MEISLRGMGVSPGIAIGPALTFGVVSLEVPKHTVPDPGTEWERFQRAVGGVRSELQKLHERTAEALGEQHANIFAAHLMMLEDVTLLEEVRRRIYEEKLNAEFLVNEYFTGYAKALAGMQDPRLRERSQDVLDVGNRLVGRLLNRDFDNLEHLERPSIVVAYDLTPSDAAKLDLENTLAIATDASGPTSHTAILARAFEIPAVVGLKYVGSYTFPGDTLIVDGTSGDVVIRPSEETLSRYRARREVEARGREALRLAELKPSVTLDGFELPTMANIELPVEVAHGLRVKAQGIGLYRTEYLFLNRPSLPTEEDQYAAYAEAAEAMAPAPVVLRTLDVGGDKFATHFHMPQEPNPQLGWRSIRLCLDRPDLFRAQLRAILRASARGNVHMMFPLVSGLDEFRRAKALVKDVCAELERSGVPFNPNMPIGTMIEVPAAVEIADMLGGECDFFSIGTNDLIQYSLAVDRVNERIAHMYEPAHPAVLRMLRRTVRAARTAKIPCSICGEMAGDPLFSEFFVGLGVSALSMAPVAIPAVRAEIANVRQSLAKRLVSRVLKMGTGQEVRTLLERRYQQRRTLEAYLNQFRGPA